jgi:hypothetical protein
MHLRLLIERSFLVIYHNLLRLSRTFLPVLVFVLLLSSDIAFPVISDYPQLNDSRS